jgi:hypothetical protein
VRRSGGARLNATGQPGASTIEPLLIHPPPHHPPPSGGLATPQSPRPRDWAGLTDRDVLARYRPGRADPLQVLEVLLKLHDQQHTAFA